MWKLLQNAQGAFVCLLQLVFRLQRSTKGKCSPERGGKYPVYMSNRERKSCFGLRVCDGNTAWHANAGFVKTVHFQVVWGLCTGERMKRDMIDSWSTGHARDGDRKDVALCRRASFVRGTKTHSHGSMSTLRTSASCVATMKINFFHISFLSSHFNLSQYAWYWLHWVGSKVWVRKIKPDQIFSWAQKHSRYEGGQRTWNKKYQSQVHGTLKITITITLRTENIVIKNSQIQRRWSIYNLRHGHISVVKILNNFWTQDIWWNAFYGVRLPYCSMLRDNVIFREPARRTVSHFGIYILSWLVLRKCRAC